MIDILFVCIHNAGRSQMAEAFFNALAPSGVKAASAGTHPTERIGSTVVEAMAEVGIDISEKRPRALLPELAAESKRLITMGCGVAESCPSSILQIDEDWGIPDPAGQALHEVRLIRDAVKAKVEDLIRRNFLSYLN